MPDEDVVSSKVCSGHCLFHRCLDYFDCFYLYESLVFV